MKPAYFIYIFIVVFLSLLVLSASFYAERLIKANFFQEYLFSARETIDKNAHLILNEEILSNPFNSRSQEQFEMFYANAQNPSVARFTVWNKDKIIIFSDLKNIIGYHSPDHSDLKKLFSQESPFFILKEKDTNKPLQSNVGEFLDVYIPLTMDGKITGAVEIQGVTEAILKPLESGFRILGYVIGGMAVLLIIASLMMIMISVLGPSRLLEKSKTEFVAITAHELRTPTTIISGNIERLLKIIDKHHINHGIYEMVSDIRKQSDRLLMIVNELLDITVLEEKKVIFKKEKIDIAALIRETVEDLQPKAEEKNLSLSFALPLFAAMAFSDKERARQVLVNLIANAIHYTEKGGVTIRLEQSGSFLKILITDTGIGIPLERQESLFQKFQVIGEQFMRSREYGSGMGLYISKMMAEAMGGMVRLEKSEIGRGSVFSFILPVAS